MMNLTAFLSYIVLTAFTPGPNNIMAMSNAARVGFRRGLIFCVGVLLGFLVDMSLCALFTSLLFQYIPAITPVMKGIGAAYILFLAYVILRDKPSKGERKQLFTPGSIWNGMMMQFVNVKVILYGITAMSAFVLPYSQAPLIILAAVLVLSFTGFAGTCCWALFGSLFQRLFETHRKPMNLIMALLLVYCAVMTVL